jgi:hypothetical protein
MRLRPIVGAISMATFFGLASTSDAAPRNAFATSVWGPGDMHSWPDASGTNLQGLAAADYTCQARASDAGLGNPENYVAWLSDRNNDAYCRIFGFSGKKADKCGQAGLPIGAGPWVRVDGTPFAATIERALDEGAVYAPLNVDEFGQTFYTNAQSFTATDFDGTFTTEFEADGDCEEWTSAVQDPSGPFPTLGSNLATTDQWTFDDSGVSCDGTRRLMCLQRKPGGPSTGHARFGRREAFVTSTEVTGNLSGLAGADALCASSAAAAGLYRPDSFKALLASSSTFTNITDRINVDGEWYRRDGLLFAHSKAELIGGAVRLPLNVTEFGDYLGYGVALTGALHGGGAFPGFDCSGWTSAGGMASGSVPSMVAFAPSGGHNWLNIAEVACGANPLDPPLRLYCLSDADVIFHDGMDEHLMDL